MLIAAGAVVLHRRAPAPPPSVSAPSSSSVEAPVASPSAAPGSDADPAEEAAQCAARPLRLPKGEPPGLSCLAARRVITQVRHRSALPPSPPKPTEFADSVSGWLDPHGMWSAAPDSPVRSLVKRHAAALLREIEASPTDDAPCAAAEELGRATRDWVRELGAELGEGERAARRVSREVAFALASEGVFQDDPVTRPGRELARDLGQRIGTFRSAYGRPTSVEHAATRLLPSLAADAWARVILAAAVRAYVPAIDPHGQWAPFEEEWSLYSADPALASEPQLWGRMMRTALGVKVLEDATPPLAEGDLVLEVAGVPTVGLSVEQLEQLSHLESIGGEPSREVVVLRKGDAAPRRLSVPLDESAPPVEQASPKTTVPYGDGDVWVVSIADVPDELGEELEQLVAAVQDEDRPPLGILLDLRGNGGGSLDGAIGAIGVFLPGVPSFPLRRRDGVVEVQNASTPASAAQWHGPVAALVDGFTASAAEMIAGAIAGYQRGPVIGARTFGKGCVQEYFDDRAGAGVLRLTTMLFSLPDGAPLQGVGLSPTLPLALPAADERERSIPGALRPWRGPDVRRADSMGGPEWPSHAGRLGACTEAAVCAALRRLGQPRRSAAVLPGSSPRRGLN